MGKSKTLILFFVCFSIIFTSLYLVKGLNSNNEFFVEAVDKTYKLQVSSEMNKSEYFLHIEGEIFEFNITVSSWGNTLQGPYNGLMVELVRDSDDIIYDSWLINHGDTTTHHFTSIEAINGIVRIRTSSLYIEECVFDLTTLDIYPLWSYSLNIQLEQQYYFSVERFYEYYYSINKLCFILNSRYLDPDNYTVNLVDSNQDTVETMLDNFAVSDVSELEMYVDEGVYEGEWYEINFNFSGYDLENEIQIRMYYDHIQTENIARVFLNIGSKDIYQIPIDYHHSHWPFLWTIEEEYTYIYSPPFNFKPLIYTIVCILYIIGSFSVFKAYKRKRARNSSEFELNRNKVEYSPNHSYKINFKSTDINYDLVTNEAVTVACSICMQTITNKENIIRCPSCDIAFHKNHLYQWVVGNGTCPACKVRLKIQQQ